MPRGRKPLPPELKIAKLNERPTSSAGPFSTLRTSGRPDKPASIAGCPHASAEWDRLVDLLSGRSVLAPGDAGVLSAYCSAWSTIVRCREALNACGSLTVENVISGVVKPHPLLVTLSQAEKSLVSFAAELGLSPTARGRVALIEDLSSADPLDEFLEA